MRILEKILGRHPHWGVHPDDHKRPAADAPLRSLPLPEVLYVPLQQHVGNPARPVVLVGERVLKGDLIAEPNGNISAPVHAPTSGWISAIGEITAPHPSGLPQLAVTITADGADAWCERLPVADPFALAPEEISRRTAAAGVVGLGGATFPAAVKFNLGRRLQVGTLIVNGGECEPYLSSDDRIMRDRAAEVVDGLRIVMHAIGAREALIGIEDNKPQAIAAMQSEPTQLPDLMIDRARAYAMEEDWRRSEEDLSRSLDIRADDPMALRLRASARMHQRSFTLAEADALAAARIEPENVDNFLVLGHVRESIRTGAPVEEQ